MNRFRNPVENKFGMKPPNHRINPETIEKSMENALPMVMMEPQPIWEILGITGEEYYQQYHTQPVSENALEIQQSIAEETKMEENVIVETNPPEEMLENFIVETNP